MKHEERRGSEKRTLTESPLLSAVAECNVKQLLPICILSQAPHPETYCNSLLAELFSLQPQHLIQNSAACLDFNLLGVLSSNPPPMLPPLAARVESL